MVSCSGSSPPGPFPCRLYLLQQHNRWHRGVILKLLVSNTTEKILKDYQEIETKAKELLEKNDEEPKGEGMMTKMMSSMGVIKEVNKDNSDSAIADMLIKGISMGSIEMERKIKDYSKEVDKKILKLAEDFLEFQENSIEKLKEFL